MAPLCKHENHQYKDRGRPICKSGRTSGCN